jgi:hypothetical protein
MKELLVLGLCYYFRTLHSNFLTLIQAYVVALSTSFLRSLPI